MTHEEITNILVAHGKWLRGTGGTRADLRGANLSDADLRGAYLRGADLSEAKNLNFPIACPGTGAFTGWKKCKNNIIVKLLIPEDSKRVSSTGRKCRCSKAIVLEIQNIDGTRADIEEAISMYDPGFSYHEGETKEVNNFDENRWNECSTGIRFFITRQEAVEY